MAVSALPVLAYINVRSVRVLEIHHFRRGLTYSEQTLARLVRRRLMDRDAEHDQCDAQDVRRVRELCQDDNAD